MHILPKITLRIGAAYDMVTVDGTKFDRSRMIRPERGQLRRLLVGGLEAAGYFKHA